MKNVAKAWRDSATLIMLARHNRGSLSRQCDDIRYNTNYDILLQTRTNTASSYANTVVFPGGVSEAADASDKWLHLIKSYGYNQRHFDLLHCDGSTLTPLFIENPVNRHIALRITAIRETFEECGLLVCSRRYQNGKLEPWGRVILDIDIKHWQDRVSKNPEEFFELCEQHNCYPDIWSLHYWSNWLTPIDYKRRFDTAFFIAAIENTPQKVQGSSEVANLEWCAIEDILRRNSNKEAELYPPQFYELQRLLHISDIDEVVSFASKRSGYGTEVLFPNIVHAKDGTIYLLPGDSQYPTNVDYHHKPIDSRDKTILELREDVHCIHRFEYSKDKKELCIHNYRPSNHIIMGNKVLNFEMHRTL